MAGRLDEVLIHTGQHYDYAMSRVFFEELGIRAPDRHLEVGSGTHAEQTGRVLERVEAAVVELAPDLVTGVRRHQLDARGGARRRQVPERRSRTSRLGCAPA